MAKRSNSYLLPDGSRLVLKEVGRMMVGSYRIGRYSICTLRNDSVAIQITDEPHSIAPFGNAAYDRDRASMRTDAAWLIAAFPNHPHAAGLRDDIVAEAALFA